MACIASKLCDNGSISSGVTLRRFYMFRLPPSRPCEEFQSRAWATTLRITGTDHTCLARVRCAQEMQPIVSLAEILTETARRPPGFTSVAFCSTLKRHSPPCFRRPHRPQVRSQCPAACTASQSSRDRELRRTLNLEAANFNPHLQAYHCSGRATRANRGCRRPCCADLLRLPRAPACLSFVIS